MMIEVNILKEPYCCRTKDLLWARETRQMLDLLVHEKNQLQKLRNWFDMKRKLYSSDRKYFLKIVNDKTGIENI